MPNAGFVHLHVHSAYSLLKGSLKIAKLGELAKADRQPALALTDTDNLFGALEFSDKMAGTASSRSSAASCGRFRRPGPQCAQRACRSAGADRAARRARARLPQPDAAQFARLSRDAGAPGAAYQVRLARGRSRGPDRADRRSGRADRSRSAPATPSLRRRAASGWQRCSATGSMSSCSATAWTGSAASSRR